MDVTMILFGLRLLSTAVLLTFMLAVSWLIYKDMRVTTAVLHTEDQPRGYLYMLTTGEELPLLPLTSIGRAPSNTIVVDDGFTSSEHALITLRGQRWWLEDLGSRNGTLLNEMPLNEAVVIGGGDVLTIGQTRFKVVL